MGARTIAPGLLCDETAAAGNLAADAAMRAPRFVVVGIGADGWDGPVRNIAAELRSATDIYGSARQLDLLAPLDATPTRWDSPMSEHLRRLLAERTPADPVHILASGDPMFHGVGASIVKQVGARQVRSPAGGLERQPGLGSPRLGPGHNPHPQCCRSTDRLDSLRRHRQRSPADPESRQHHSLRPSPTCSPLTGSAGRS